MVSTTFIGEVVADEVPATPGAAVTVPAVSCTLSLALPVFPLPWILAAAGVDPDDDSPDSTDCTAAAVDAKDTADVTPPSPWRRAGTPLWALALPDVAADESDLDRVCGVGKGGLLGDPLADDC